MDKVKGNEGDKVVVQFTLDANQVDALNTLLSRISLPSTTSRSATPERSPRGNFKQERSTTATNRDPKNWYRKDCRFQNNCRYGEQCRYHHAGRDEFEKQLLQQANQPSRDRLGDGSYSIPKQKKENSNVSAQRDTAEQVLPPLLPNTQPAPQEHTGQSQEIGAQAQTENAQETVQTNDAHLFFMKTLPPSNEIPNSQQEVQISQEIKKAICAKRDQKANLVRKNNTIRIVDAKRATIDAYFTPRQVDDVKGLQKDSQ